MQNHRFSDGNHKPRELDAMIAAVPGGELPPVHYWIVHPDAGINAPQKRELIKALETSINRKTAFELRIFP
jgi:hypothetical protein